MIEGKLFQDPDGGNVCRGTAGLHVVDGKIDEAEFANPLRGFERVSLPPMVLCDYVAEIDVGAGGFQPAIADDARHRLAFDGEAHEPGFAFDPDDFAELILGFHTSHGSPEVPHDIRVRVQCGKGLDVLWNERSEDEPLRLELHLAG